MIRYVVGHDDLRWATRRVAASGNCTVRVLPVPGGPSARAVHDRLAPFGLGGEVFSDELPLPALTVPAGADLAAVKAVLDHGEAEGWWRYETPCVTPAWEAA